MKQSTLFLLGWLLLLATLQGQSLESCLASRQDIRLEKLSSSARWPERYLLYISQPLDPEDPALGTYPQRVMVNISSPEKPIVFVTEGYAADYALRPQYAHELSDLLDANQVVVEHRFFAPSVPEGDSIPWQYLTAENAAADHHRVITALKTCLRGKWISTGISKGGQATMFHRTLYPDDVDASLAYVAPLNFSVEDLRVYDFLDQVGEEECRNKVRRFQEMMLRNKPLLLPHFEKVAQGKKLEYTMGLEAAYELIVLEYAFAFWQWGNWPCEAIPTDTSQPRQLIRHLDDIAGLDWVAKSFVENHPFFYQALTQIGMYGYRLEDFGALITALDKGTFHFACPPGIQCTFNPDLMQEVDSFLRHRAERFMLLYGEWDPWSATAVQWSGNPGLKVLYKSRGSHQTRLRHLPQQELKEVLDTLKSWLEE